MFNLLSSVENISSNQLTSQQAAFQFSRTTKNHCFSIFFREIAAQQCNFT